MEESNAVEDEPTPATSAKQLSSSDEVFVAAGGNNGIGVLERPSPLPPVVSLTASAVPTSSDAALALGTQTDSATPVPTPMNDPPTQ